MSKNAHDVFGALCAQLIAEDLVVSVSNSFAQLSDDRRRVEFAIELLERFKLFPQFAEEKTLWRKSDEECQRFRCMAEAENGNKLYLLWEMYSKAIAAGNTGSEELGKAYFGRSQVICKLGDHSGCAQDLQHAQNCRNINPAEIALKLQECNASTDKIKSATKTTQVPTITPNSNKSIACAGSSIKIINNSVTGRGVIATKDIQIGEVIAVEQPYAAILLLDSEISLTHCYQCLKMSYSLLPCDHCTIALFCSAECKNCAWENHHQFECPIIGVLQSLELSKLTLCALRVAILAGEHYDEIDSLETDNALVEAIYESGRYKEIHNLCTNTELRSVADLFNRAVTAAIIFNQIKINTDFFKLLGVENQIRNENVFMGLLLRHMQTAPSNFHEISEKLVRGIEEFDVSIEIGAAAYAFLSMLNHSCSPNVVRHCYGSTTVLRALGTIKKGEELFDNYGYHYAVMSRSERRKQLKSQYLFECGCHACIHDWPLYDRLETFPNQPQITIEDIEALKCTSDIEIRRILQELIGKATTLQSLETPSKNLADIQECMKECYARLANKRCIE